MLGKTSQDRIYYAIAVTGQLGLILWWMDGWMDGWWQIISCRVQRMTRRT